MNKVETPTGRLVLLDIPFYDIPQISRAVDENTRFWPAQGYAFVDCDYSALELRCAAAAFISQHKDTYRRAR